MNNPIVVGTDGSATAEHAVEWAAAEAARLQSRLHVVHAVWSRECGFPYQLGPWATEALTEAGEQILLRATELVAKAVPDLTVTTELAFETPGFVLREWARRATEIVVGHRGLGGFAGLLLGSTGLALAGRTPCPLIVVRGGTAEERNQVLVGVDLRDSESSGVLEYAFEAAASRVGWVQAVHTWEVPPTLFNGAYPVTVRQALGAVQERLAQAIAPWRARYPDVRVIEETPAGRPVDELVKRSDRAGLLVVGSYRHGPHLGSVSHGVIHHAECPVAVVGARVPQTRSG